MKGFLKRFLKGRKKGIEKRWRNGAYYAELVQKAVRISVAIKEDMDRESLVVMKRLAEFAAAGEGDKLTAEGTRADKWHTRRLRTLNRIRKVQEDAFIRAYGRKPPGFGYRARTAAAITIGEEIP